MEILPLGPCVLIDTAGFDDTGKVGDLRTERTREVIKQADIAIVVTDGATLDDEAAWAGMLKQANVPYVAALNKVDLMNEVPSTLLADIAKRLGCDIIPVSAMNGTGLELLRKTLAGLMPESGNQSLTGNLAQAGDTVLLVMPQDPQAPKGRLILPQVQTLRDLMDKRCIAICCTTEDIDSTLAALHEPPRLIITDSQVFDIVEKKKPREPAHLLLGTDGSPQGRHPLLCQERHGHRPLDRAIARAHRRSLYPRPTVRGHRSREDSAHTAPARGRRTADRYRCRQGFS